jgi:hypothetical protein
MPREPGRAGLARATWVDLSHISETRDSGVGKTTERLSFPLETQLSSGHFSFCQLQSDRAFGPFAPIDSGVAPLSRPFNHAEDAASLAL